MKDLTKKEYAEISKFLTIGINIAGTKMKFPFKHHQLPDVVSDAWLRFVKSYDKKSDDCPDASWAVRIGTFTGQDFVRKYISKEKPLVGLDELNVHDRQCLAVTPVFNTSQMTVDMVGDSGTSTAAHLLSEGWSIPEISEQMNEEPGEIMNKYIKNIKKLLKNNKK